jgi:hypothetical protein
MAARNFPGPTTNDCVEDDPLMKRRPPDHMEIGARPATLKQSYDERAGMMGIKHVGDQNSTGKR